MLPTQKIPHQRVTLGFRPMISATGPAIRAPNNVPMESCKSQYALVAVRIMNTYQGDNQPSTDVAKVEGPVGMALTETLSKVWHFEET